MDMMTKNGILGKSSGDFSSNIFLKGCFRDF